MRNADRTGIRADSPDDLDSIATTIEEFIRLLDDGQAPDVDTFCARHPGALRDGIRKGCLNYLRVQGLLGQLGAHGGEPNPEGRLGDFKLLREIGRTTDRARVRLLKVELEAIADKSNSPRLWAKAVQP